MLCMSFSLREFFFRYHRLQEFPFSEVSLAGILLEIATPPPVISNGPPLIIRNSVNVLHGDFLKFWVVQFISLNTFLDVSFIDVIGRSFTRNSCFYKFAFTLSVFTKS